MKSTMIYSLLMVFVSFFTMLPFTHAKVVGAWLFDDGWRTINQRASGFVEDATGNGHDGEIAGTPRWRVGKFGSALEFAPDADDPEAASWSYVKVPYHADLDLTQFTFTAWIKVPKTLDPLQMIINREFNFDLRNYALWIRTANDGEWPLQGGGGRAGDFACAWGTAFPAVKHFGVEKTQNVTNNQWHFVACSFDGVMMTAYVDGKKRGTEENKLEQGIRPKPNKPKEAPLLIGARALHDWVGSTRPFIKGIDGVGGLVDDVGLFDTGLSAEEIQGIMELGLAKKYDEIRAVNPRGKLATTWAELKAQ